MMIGIFLTVLVTILVAWYLFRKRDTGDYKKYKEPTIICVFPDYPREMPLEADRGDNLRFYVRGYSDKYKMREVELKEEDIEWQRQNYVGFFDNTKADKIYGTREVFYNLPDGIENRGKLVYLTARYHGLSDSTWIKISEV